MDSLLEKYKDLWSPLIKPDDYKYSLCELDPYEKFMSDGERVVREEFTVTNLHG